MKGNPIEELELAASYLDDAENKIAALDSHSEMIDKCMFASSVRDTEIALAMKELDKAEEKGIEVNKLRGHAYFLHALLNRKVGYSWAEENVNLLLKAVACDPHPIAYYNLGIAYRGEKRYAEAIEVLQKASDLADDQETRLESKKMIGKIELEMQEHPEQAVFAKYGVNELVRRDEFIGYIMKQQPIQAIKVLREEKNIRIEEAKDAVDAIRSELCDLGVFRHNSTTNAFNEGGCYIATACYGSYDHPDVIVLRRFRDQRLLPSPIGKHLVALYYAVSPILAVWIGRNHRLSGIMRQMVLEPVVRKLSRWDCRKVEN